MAGVERLRTCVARDETSLTEAVDTWRGLEMSEDEGEDCDEKGAGLFFCRGISVSDLLTVR